MKLKKLLIEDMGAPPMAQSPTPPSFAVAASTLPPDEEANPIGIMWLPKPMKTLSPDAKFRFNIDKEREMAEAEEQAAMRARAAGQIVQATQLQEKAFKRLQNIIDTNVLSGLKTKSFDKARSKARERHDQGAFSGYFVLAADLDHFKWVNKVMGHAGADSALYFLGDLFKKFFEGNSKLGDRVQAFHPHGDEFAVVINAMNNEGKPLSYVQCQAIVVEIVQAAKNLSAELASTAWQIRGRKLGVQITASWGLSTTYELANDLLLRGKGENKETRFFLNIDSTLVQYYKLDRMEKLLDPLADLRVPEEGGGLKPILPGDSDSGHPPAGPADQSMPMPGAGPTPSPRVNAPSVPLEHRAPRKSKVMAEAMKMKQPTQQDALAFLSNQRGLGFIQSNPYAWTPEDKEKIAKCRDEQQAYRKNPKFFNPITGGPLDSAYSPHPSVDSGTSSKGAM